MGKSLLKIGQLVYGDTTMSYTTSKGGYGIVVDMIDLSGKSHNELIIITGNGDKNTRVEIKVKILTHPSNDIWMLNSQIHLLDNPIVDSFDPHDIIIISYDRFQKIYDEAISNMNYKMSFIKKYHLTRDEKIDIILE